MSDHITISRDRINKFAPNLYRCTKGPKSSPRNPTNWTGPITKPLQQYAQRAEYQ